MMIPFVLPAKDPKGPIESFRLEVYRDGKSAVYYTHKTPYGTSLYYRDAGERDGWFLSKVYDSIIDDVTKIYKKHKLASYPTTSFDEEDKHRSRWMVEVTYNEKQKKDIIVYYEGAPTEEELKIENEVVTCVHNLLDKMEKDGWKCEHSRNTYGPDGKLLKRVDYTADGIVHGGYDARDPLATF